MLLIEDVIDPAGADRVLDAIKTAPWTDGHAHTEEYKTQVKHNKELRGTPGSTIKMILDGLQKTIWKNEQFLLYAHPKVGVSLRFNKYETGGFYGPHADAPVMGNPPIRSDLSMTLFLSDPADYDGGELVIEGVKYKGPKGSVLVYPSYYVHEVLPVTRGERIAAVAWIQSTIRDESMRKLMSRFYKMGTDIKNREGFSDLYTECASLYSNLMRLNVE